MTENGPTRQSTGAGAAIPIKLLNALYDCMHITDGDVSCVPLFLSIMLLANFLVFNLFVAILLEAFNVDNLRKESEKEKRKKRAKRKLMCVLRAVHAFNLKVRDPKTRTNFQKIKRTIGTTWDYWLTKGGRPDGPHDGAMSGHEDDHGTHSSGKSGRLSGRSPSCCVEETTNQTTEFNRSGSTPKPQSLGGQKPEKSEIEAKNIDLVDCHEKDEKSEENSQGCFQKATIPLKFSPATQPPIIHPIKSRIATRQTTRQMSSSGESAVSTNNMLPKKNKSLRIFVPEKLENTQVTNHHPTFTETEEDELEDSEDQCKKDGMLRNDGLSHEISNRNPHTSENQKFQNKVTPQVPLPSPNSLSFVQNPKLLVLNTEACPTLKSSLSQDPAYFTSPVPTTWFCKKNHIFRINKTKCQRNVAK